MRVAPSRRVPCPSIVAALALAVGLAACGGKDSRNDTGLGAGSPELAPCPADTSKLIARIYVDSSLSTGKGCGAAMVSACPTIQQGIDACDGNSSCGVLVRHGLYPITATLKLRDGIGVFGSCLFNGEPAQGYRSVVKASPMNGAPAVLADGINTPTSFADIMVVGADETVGGMPSIVMAVSNGSRLVLSRSVLVGGRGAPGETPGTASRGVEGNAASAAKGPYAAGTGGPACPAGYTNSGGNGASSNALTTDHHGLWVDCSNSNAPGTGPNGQKGGDAGVVKGAPGGAPGDSACTCPGPTSAPTTPAGDPGVCATAAGNRSVDAWGKVAGTGWTPGQGGGGFSGSPGSGGGGGGGGGYSADYSSNDYDFSGYAGGGGGGGGCGGTGGTGGQQGGASLALLLSSATFVNDGAVVIPGAGGPGGTGGQGGQGGPGGPGQAGWPGFDQRQRSCRLENGDPVPAPGSGGRGGDGGTGGPGSGGGGGNGGPSIALALANGAKSPMSLPMLYEAQPGPGGAGGAGGTGGNADCTSPTGSGGDGGGGAFLIDFDQLSGGVLAEGQRLGMSESLWSPDRRYELTMRQEGSLCLYSAADMVWCWNVGRGNDGHSVLLQTDGNLCMQNSAAVTITCIFAGTTPPGPGAYLLVRNAGQVAITDGRADFWSAP